jgi:hypothetical protein
LTMGGNHFYHKNQAVAWKAMCIMPRGSMRWRISFQDISLHISYGCLVFSIDISFYSPGYFIGISYGCLAFLKRYFIPFPRIFHWDFHMDAWNFQ